MLPLYAATSDAGREAAIRCDEGDHPMSGGFLANERVLSSAIAEAGVDATTGWRAAVGSVADDAEVKSYIVCIDLPPTRTQG